MRYATAALLSVLALLIAGCAPLFVRSNVSVFHEMPSSSQTFVVLPFKEQEGSLEFKAYAQQVKDQLVQRGFSEAPIETANIAVFMRYGVDDGKQVLASYPIFGQTGTSSSYTSGTVTSYGNMATYSGTTYNTPTYGVTGSGVSSHTVYTRYLNLEMLDRTAFATGKITKVYEGKVKSSGSLPDLTAVMPYMLRALFEEFPGVSGKTRTVTYAIERK